LKNLDSGLRRNDGEGTLLFMVWVDHSSGPGSVNEYEPVQHVVTRRAGTCWGHLCHRCLRCATRHLTCRVRTS